jgi:hypothetical protein
VYRHISGQAAERRGHRRADAGSRAGWLTSRVSLNGMSPVLC